jgi:hypothetical protein
MKFTLQAWKRAMNSEPLNKSQLRILNDAMLLIRVAITLISSLDCAQRNKKCHHFIFLLLEERKDASFIKFLQEIKPLNYDEC